MEDPIFHATDAETDSNFPEKKNRIVFANWTGPTMNRYLGRVVRVLHKRIYRTSAGAATANLLF
jgi:hypothetical protein